MNKSVSKLALPQGDYKLVVVSKGRSTEELKKVLATTHAKDVAENRLQEAKLKFPKLSTEVKKHFIGKLQSRKIPEIVKLFDVIQSLENEKQLQIIEKSAEESGKVIDVMIQVNLSGESQRSGCSFKDFQALKESAMHSKHVNLVGVMGMASQDEKLAKEEFSQLKTLQGELPYCSMGMSSDYHLALEAGSNMLRLGRVLFLT